MLAPACLPPVETMVRRVWPGPARGFKAKTESFEPQGPNPGADKKFNSRQVTVYALKHRAAEDQEVPDSGPVSFESVRALYMGINWSVRRTQTPISPMMHQTTQPVADIAPRARSKREAPIFATR